jgi:hypothetical protein
LPRKVTFSMPSEFFLFGRADRSAKVRLAAMTPGRTGPDQCGDEHLTGCMIRAGSYRLASGNAAETNC